MLEAIILSRSPSLSRFWWGKIIRKQCAVLINKKLQPLQSCVGTWHFPVSKKEGDVSAR